MKNKKGKYELLSIRYRVYAYALIFIAVICGFLAGFLITLNLGKTEPLFVPRAQLFQVVTVAQAAETTVQPKIAKITAYSCGGLKTEAEISMNCPSLRSGGPKTASGTTPRPYITVACDRAYLGHKFDIEGIGVVICEDTGGAIKGEGRFDLYVSDVQEARRWGVQHLEYTEL
jgi:3D (Asp-Asp-Asp) domain-containing protein